MKKIPHYRAAALTFLGSIASLSAQNFSETIRSNDSRPLVVDDLEGHDSKRFNAASLPGTFEVPATKASATLSDSGEVYVSQDASTLGNSRNSRRSVDSVVDLATLREPSPFRKVAMSAGISSSEVVANGLPMGLALLSATYRAPAEATADCSVIGLSIQQRVKLDPSKILEAVEAEITANPSCACEIVKAALTAAGADATLTGQVVEVAASAAPESIRLISQCAIAAVPESLAEVQSVLAKLDPNRGESGDSSKSAKSAKSSKSAKDSKEALPPAPLKDNGNPLDLPNYGPPLPPPPINPPSITEVDTFFKVKK